MDNLQFARFVSSTEFTRGKRHVGLHRSLCWALFHSAFCSSAFQDLRSHAHPKLQQGNHKVGHFQTCEVNAPGECSGCEHWMSYQQGRSNVCYAWDVVLDHRASLKTLNFYFLFEWSLVHRAAVRAYLKWEAEEGCLSPTAPHAESPSGHRQGSREGLEQGQQVLQEPGHRHSK